MRILIGIVAFTIMLVFIMVVQRAQATNHAVLTNIMCSLPEKKADYSYLSTNLPTRNNNPGNIRISNHTYIGEIKENKSYETFIDIEWGFAAMFSLLHRKYHGLTLREAIYKWAPPFENDTEGYIKYIEKRTGYNADNIIINSINYPEIIIVVEAMAALEGSKSYSMAQIQAGWLKWFMCVYSPKL